MWWERGRHRKDARDESRGRWENNDQLGSQEHQNPHHCSTCIRCRRMRGDSGEQNTRLKHMRAAQSYLEKVQGSQPSAAVQPKVIPYRE